MVSNAGQVQGTKPGICERHGRQLFTTTSERFKLAIKQGLSIQGTDLCRLEIWQGNAKTETLIDIEIPLRLQLNIVANTVSLRDRDKVEKRLNDRLAIGRLYREQRGHWVCSACLHELLATALSQ